MFQNRVSVLQPVLVWWICLTLLWAGYRILQVESELLSEVVVKPLIWVGCVFVGMRIGLVPRDILVTLQSKFMQTRPFWKTALLPCVGITIYFFAINYGKFFYQNVELFYILQSILVNFSTGIVEEFVYRGVLYVWLMSLVDEVSAFVLVQILFLLSHVPILLVRSPSITDALVRVFFIVLIGAVHTIIFRWSRSLVASSVSHGTWNTLAQLLLKI